MSLSSELLSKLSKQVGDKVSLSLSIQDLFKGRKMIERYKSMDSEDEAKIEISEEYEK